MTRIARRRARAAFAAALILSAGLSGAGCNGAASRSAGPSGRIITVRDLEDDLSGLWTGEIFLEVAATVELGDSPRETFRVALETVLGRLDAHRNRFLAIEPEVRNLQMLQMVSAAASASPTGISLSRAFRRRVFEQLMQWGREHRTDILDAYVAMAEFEGTVALSERQDGPEAISGAPLDLDLSNLFSGRFELDWRRRVASSGRGESSVDEEWAGFLERACGEALERSLEASYAMQAMILEGIEFRRARITLAAPAERCFTRTRAALLERMGERIDRRSRRYQRLSLLFGRIDPYLAYQRAEADWRRANRRMLVGLWGPGAPEKRLWELLASRPGADFDPPPTEVQEDRMLRSVLDSFDRFTRERRAADHRLAYRLTALLDTPDREDVMRMFWTRQSVPEEEGPR